MSEEPKVPATVSEEPKAPHESAHVNIGKDRITSNLVDEWYIAKTKNAAETAYVKRVGNEFTPFVGGEDAFAKIQAQIENATDTIDIICWGFDPAMPLVRNGPPAKTWPFWYNEEATNAKLAQLQAELEAKKKEEQELKEKEAKLKEEAANAPKPTTKEQLRQVRDALKQAGKDIAAFYKAIEAFSKEDHIRPEEYSMIKGDKVLGNETLGQLLINKAMGVSTSEEFIYKGSKGKYGTVSDADKGVLVPVAAATAKEGDAAKPADPAKEGEAAAPAAEAKKGVQVRVLMWYPGLLASLGAQNAPGFVQSKFSNTIQSCLNSEIGKFITEALGGVALDAFLDAKLGKAVSAIMDGKDWEKVSNKIGSIFGSVSEDVSSGIGGKIGGKLGEAITGLGSSATKGLEGVKGKVDELLKDQSKLLKNFVLKASSTAIQGLLQELVKGIYPARDYYNQAWFTAAALSKVDNLEFRIRSFDPLLPKQLSSWLFGLDKIFSKTVKDGDITTKKKPDRAFFEHLMLEEFKSHHQKSIMIDYMKPEKANGFILGFNFKSEYWDTNQHLADEVAGRREPGAADGPYQDIATHIRGACLFDVNKNFADAWDKAEHSTQELWLAEMTSWKKWLENPSKEIQDSFKTTGKQLWEYLKGKGEEAAKDVWYGATNKKKQAEREKKRAEAEAPKAVVPGPLATARAATTVEMLVEALQKTNPKATNAGQVLRTYPENDANFSADNGIKLAYDQSIIQRPRVFTYIENQYLQLAEWARLLKTNAQKTQIFYKAAGEEVNPLSVFVVTCIQERTGMLKRHQEMLKEWDKGGQLTQMQKKEEENNKPAPTEKPAEPEVDPAVNSNNSADMPEESGGPDANSTSTPPKAEDAGSNPIAVNLAMLRAFERQEKYTDTGFFGETIEGMFAYFQGKKRVDEFDDETIKEQQDKFESGKDLDFWQNVIHPSRFYPEIYIHTKLAVVDDHVFTMGSANLNLRSMEYDSELNLLSSDAETAFAFRDKLFKQHTTPYGEVNRRTKAMKEAESNNDQEALEKLNAENTPQEPNFPQIKEGAKDIAKQVDKAHKEWIQIMKNNDKIMMEGKVRPTDEGSQPSEHEGKLETFLCRLIDQRSAGLITMG